MTSSDILVAIKMNVCSRTIVMPLDKRYLSKKSIPVKL